jgi:hypothetical protein
MLETELVGPLLARPDTVALEEAAIARYGQTAAGETVVF